MLSFVRERERERGKNEGKRGQREERKREERKRRKREKERGAKTSSQYEKRREKNTACVNWFAAATDMPARQTEVKLAHTYCTYDRPIFSLFSLSI